LDGEELAAAADDDGGTMLETNFLEKSK